MLRDGTFQGINYNRFMVTDRSIYLGESVRLRFKDLCTVTVCVFVRFPVKRSRIRRCILTVLTFAFVNAGKSQPSSFPLHLVLMLS